MRRHKNRSYFLLLCRGADHARYCLNSRKRKLRELYHYTALLNAGHPPREDDWIIRDQPDEQEARFLDDNDITK